MESIINDLAHWCPKNGLIITEDASALKYLEGVLIPSLKGIDNFEKDAKEYSDNIDHSMFEERLITVKTYMEKYIRELYKKYKDVDVVLMSSFGAKMHLQKCESDIDFGIVVHKLDDYKMDCYSHILLENGFIYTDRVFTFEKDGIHIEAKIRDNNESEDIIILHWFLDNYLDVNIKNILTYTKELAIENKQSYDGLKYLIYCGYMSYVKQLKKKIRGI